MANEFARDLRRNLTDAERLLWRHLRHRLMKVKFRRQAPIGPSVADFVCFEARLIIELDGGHHAARRDKDAARTAWLEAEGFAVLRFPNYEVFDDIESIIHAVDSALSRALPDHQGRDRAKP